MLRLFLVLCLLFNTVVGFAGIIQGNPKGNVTLTVLYDYQCPYCHVMYSRIKQLMASNPNLRVNWAPVAILNQVSVYEASAAIVATNYPGGFDAFQQLALGGPILSEKQVAGLLRQLKLSTVVFNQQLHSQAVENFLSADLKVLNKISSSGGTPVFFISTTDHPNKPQILEGEQSYKQLLGAIGHA